MAIGIPDELFWRMSPPELEAIFKRRAEDERREYLRFGLIAATIVNVHRKKGSRVIQPSDFFRELPKPEDFMDGEEAVTFMDRWAKTMNSENSSA